MMRARPSWGIVQPGPRCRRRLGKLLGQLAQVAHFAGR